MGGCAQPVHAQELGREISINASAHCLSVYEAAARTTNRNERRGGQQSAEHEKDGVHMTFQNILPAHPMQSIYDAVHRLRSDLAEQRRANAVYTQVFNELSAMSNRDLADIGVAPSDIERIASEAASAH